MSSSGVDHEAAQRQLHAAEGQTERCTLCFAHTPSGPRPPGPGPRPPLRHALRLGGLSLAGAALRLGSSRHRAARGRPERPRVLLIRPDHLGDLLMTGPAVRRLREALPEAHLAMAVGPWSAEVARREPRLDEVLVYPFPGFTRVPKDSLLAPYGLLWKVASELRGGRFDAAVVLRFDHWWGAWLAALAGIPVRVGRGVRECAPFLTHPIPSPGRVHWVEQGLQVADGLLREWSTAHSPEVESRTSRGEGGGGPVRPPRSSDRGAGAHVGAPLHAPGLAGPAAGRGGRLAAPLQASGLDAAAEDKPLPYGFEALPLSFALSESDEQQAGRLWAEIGMDAHRPVAAFHPGTGSPLKLWPRDHWIALGWILAARGARVVVTGSMGEAAEAERIARSIPDGASLAGRTGLGALGALFRRCRLVVGVDSGPLHLAVAVGSPTVHLFGPSDPVVFGPWGDPRRHRVVSAGVAPFPCGSLDMDLPGGEPPPCMRAITPEQVAATCLEVMSDE